MEHNHNHATMTLPPAPQMPAAAKPHDQFHHLHRDHHSNRWVLVATLVAGAIILTPIVAGLLSNADLTSNLVTDAVSQVTNNCQGPRLGAAGVMADLFSHVPLIGAGLAEGGIVNTITSATLGIGGMVLGHYVARHDDGTSSIRWGNVIKTAALVTSFLVASPAIFTALTMGVSFIGIMLGFPDALGTALATLGTTGVAPTATAGLGVIGAHLFTCGPAIIGVAATAGSHEILNKQDAKIAEVVSNNAHEHHEHDEPPSAPTHRIKVLSVSPAFMQGQESTVRFRLENLQTGQVLPVDKMQEMHGMPVHAFITQAGLDEYHHVHPQPVEGQAGVFEFKVTPETNRPYKMFADIKPAGGKYQALMTDLPTPYKNFQATLEQSRKAQPVAGASLAV